MNRRRSHFVKRTVHTVANLELVLKRFEVNVRGLFLDGLVEHQVHKTHNRGGIRIGLRLVFALVGRHAQLAEHLIEAA